MFLITVRAKPAPENKEFTEVGGAFVNCWINYTDIHGSRVLSNYYIGQEKWIPETITEEKEISVDNLDNSEDKQYFQEATDYGYSLSFYCWSADAPDKDEDTEAQQDAAANP